jgi:hypothetical protein
MSNPVRGHLLYIRAVNPVCVEDVVVDKLLEYPSKDTTALESYALATETIDKQKAAAKKNFFIQNS